MTLRTRSGANDRTIAHPPARGRNRLDTESKMTRDPDVEGTATTTPTATMGAVESQYAHSNAATTDSSEKDLCRYPNKRCWSKRALKENGELHKFCEWHRNCANEYQRRLEQRRRNKRLNIAPPEKLKPNMCLSGIQAGAVLVPGAAAAAARDRGSTQTSSTGATARGAGGDEYEPFRDPVPLQTEDLHYLSLCFLDQPPPGS